jgi:acyl-CoA reductase-like NAD-dependent aldehyde dehydrogenase
MKAASGAVEVPAADLAKSYRGRAGAGFAQDLFDKQKACFATDVTKTYDWRIDQLDRLSRMLQENNERFSEASRRDFKTALPENIFEVSATIASIEFTKSQLKEWMKPFEAPLPKFLAQSGHKGIVYREPFGVTLIICPFNGPLLLSLRPATTALSAGNPCLLKLSEVLFATDELLLELIPKYFEPEALAAVTGSRQEVTELLQLPFDFIFLTGSVGAGKAVMRAAAEHLTPVLLELGGQNPAIVIRNYASEDSPGDVGRTRRRRELSTDHRHERRRQNRRAAPRKQWLHMYAGKSEGGWRPAEVRRWGGDAMGCGFQSAQGKADEHGAGHCLHAGGCYTTQ